MQRKSVSYAKYGYIFSLPFVVAFAVFAAWPLIYTVIIGFTDLRGMGKTDFHFLANPFDNFKTIHRKPVFPKIVVHDGADMGHELHTADNIGVFACRLVHE